MTQADKQEATEAKRPRNLQDVCVGDPGGMGQVSTCKQLLCIR